MSRQNACVAGGIKIAKEIETDSESKPRQESQQEDWVEPLIRELAANQEFAKTIAGDTTLLKWIARDDSLASRISLRLRNLVLKSTFLHELTDAVLEKKGSQIKRHVVEQCKGFLERKRIMMRLERVEEKIDTFNRELNSLVKLVKSLLPTN